MDAALIMLLIATIFLLVYFIVDRVITTSRLRDNQKAWDEYSEGMTLNEKFNVYNEWCRRRKIEKHWEYFYFPRM